MHTSRTTSSATLVDAPVVDGDLGGRAGVQCVEQFRIVQEHGGLVILAGDGIVDVGEGKTFGKLVPHLKNPIRPDAADGDGLLHRARHPEFDALLFSASVKRFYHGISPCSFVSFWGGSPRQWPVPERGNTHCPTGTPAFWGTAVRT